MKLAVIENRDGTILPAISAAIADTEHTIFDSAPADSDTVGFVTGIALHGSELEIDALVVPLFGDKIWRAIRTLYVGPSVIAVSGLHAYASEEMLQGRGIEYLARLDSSGSLVEPEQFTTYLDEMWLVND